MSSVTEDDAVFKALASSTRRDLLDALRDSPKTTGQLCAQFPELDRCTVMQHLKVLEQADLVIPRREGRERWNHLNPLPIKHIHDRWIGAYATGAVNLLDRLKQEVERRPIGKPAKARREAAKSVQNVARRSRPR